MREAEIQRVGTGGGGEFVHETFAREIIRGGGKAAIGAVAQRRFGIHVAALIFGDADRDFRARHCRS